MSIEDRTRIERLEVEQEELRSRLARVEQIISERLSTNTPADLLEEIVTQPRKQEPLKIKAKNA